MALNHLKMIEDKKLSELEGLIQKQEEELKQYERLGKNEIKELALEYKKLCSLIECKKENR